MSDKPTPTGSATGSGPAAGERVLVTGASGFVGRYVVRELVARGYQPVCLVRDADRMRRQLNPEQCARVHMESGDLFDVGALDRVAQGCTAAIHLVGIIEEKPLVGQTFHRIHTEGTRNVVATCSRIGVGRYAHMSALGTRPNALSKYHKTKWAAEEIVRASSLQWTIFRPSIIHGPDSEFIQMMRFFATSWRQPFMPYFGKGERLVQPVSVRDVAAVFVKCLSMPETVGKVYDLAGPERLTWKQLYDVCAMSITGRKRLKAGIPVTLAKLAALTVVPFTPSVLMPYKFNVGQVQMSQEDSVADTRLVEETFGIRLRDFREELSYYADQI